MKTVELTLSQLATAKNGYGYTDYETTLIRIPGLIVEMILTIPFDEPSRPYLTFVVGDEGSRSDETATLDITKDQADALLRS